MNKLRNRVSLIGRVGATPEYIKFDSGRALVRFSLATNESRKNKEGDWEDIVQWHMITAWGKTADLIHKLVSKGHELVIEGRLVNNSYETKEGEKRYGTVVECDAFLLLTPKSESTDGQS